MAITGIFQANFDSFYDAVEKADVQLKGFEDDANKVGNTLNRLAVSFSGKQIVQDATMMAKAIEEVGGVSKLTEAELTRVSAKAAEAVEKMRALGIEVPANLQKLADASKAAADANEAHSISVGKLIEGYISAEAIMKLVETAWEFVTSQVKESITAASDAETAHAQLMTALQAQGLAVPAVVAAYGQYAAALQKTTIYSDDAIEASEALLTQIGGVMPRDMENALKAATNLASGLRIDLNDATMMVAKAAEGNTQALKRHGVELDEATAKSGDFGKVLDAINDKFKGQAETMAGTYAGRLQQIGNAWNNVQESIGRVITQNATVLRAIDLINQALTDNTGELNQNATVNNLVSEAVIGVVKALDLSLTALDYVQAAWKDFQVAGNEVGIGFLHLSQLIIDATASILNAQKYLNPTAWSATEAMVQGLGQASAYLQTRMDALAKSSNDAIDRSTQWSGTIAGMHTAIADFTTKLEETRGKTVEVAGATQTGADAFERHTKAVAGANPYMDKFNEALREALSIGVDYKATLDTIDGTVVEGTKHYLEAGMAQDKIAILYGITALQVKAVDLAMKDEIATGKQRDAQAAASAKLAQDYQKAVGAASHDTMAAQIADVTAAADAQVAQMKKAGTLTVDTYNQIWATANQTYSNIIQKTFEQDQYTQAHYKLLADQAQIAYDRATKYSDQYTAKRIDQLRQEAQKAQETLVNWQQAADDALTKTSSTADIATAAIAKTNKELAAVAAWSGRMSSEWSLSGPDDPKLATFGASAQAARDDYGNWYAYIPGVNAKPKPEAQQPGGLGGIAGARAAGGPVAGGSTYLVGEKGPELFVPQTAGRIVSNSDMTQLSMHAGAVQMNYPIMSDPSAMNQIASVVGDAIMAKLRRSGAL
jgi:hypothetical protein